MTWLESIIKSLEGSDGKSANEIWKFIQDKNLIKTKAKDPLNNVVYPLLQRHTDNIQDERSGKSYFTSFGTPRKFKLIEIDSYRIKKFGEIDTDDNDIEETETPVEKIKVYKPNPFKQSICVLGDPGVGKSVTIRNILRNENHIFQIIEPTATTTGLLSQFSPSKHEYVPSRIGKLLIESSNNPNNLYTVVIDEFHKSNVIEMVNDELKHAISLKRYSGDRFILIDDATEYLKEYLEEDDGGNAMVPDNFGFIFISSKPRVISNNKDIFDRLDVVILKEENRSIDSSEELLNLKISEEEKRKLSSSRND